MTKSTKRTTKKTTTKKTAKPKREYTSPVLVLKTTGAGGVPHCLGADDGKGGKIMTSFVWPRSGRVECPDWNPEPKCGGGFHGLEFGEGSWGVLNEDRTPFEEWRVIRVDQADVVRLSNNDSVKVKFRTGEIIYCGNKAGALTLVMCGKEAMERAMKLADNKRSGNSSRSASSGNSSRSASSGDSSRSASSGNSSRSASSGDYSISASSGNSSISASSGDYSSSASSGNSSISASSGDYSISASSGDYSSSASSGDYSISASSGNSSISASSGDYSISASSGDYSISASSGNSSSSASSGDYSRSASSGDYSISASSGNSSSSEQIGKSGIAAAIGGNVCGKAGKKGLLILTYWDAKEERYHACVGEVGRDIEADTWYQVVDGKLAKV
jgi:hypothetical protein